MVLWKIYAVCQSKLLSDLLNAVPFALDFQSYFLNTNHPIDRLHLPVDLVNIVVVAAAAAAAADDDVAADLHTTMNFG